MGNVETITKMGGKRAEFAQISNRTKQRKFYRNTDIQREDICCKLFPILEAEKMYAEIDYLLRIAHTPSAIRGVMNLFSNAYDNEDITLKGLNNMAHYMEV